MELLQPLPTVIGNPTATRALIRSIFPHRYDHLGQVASNELALAFAHQFGVLCGPSYSAPDGSANAADFVTFGVFFGLQRAFGIANAAEAFPDTPTDTLPQWESMLAVQTSASATDDQQRAAILAKYRTRFAGSPQGIIRALTPLLGTAPTILEGLARGNANPRGVFYFAVALPAGTLSNAALTASVRAIVEQMKPAHTFAQITDTQTAGFFTDDPNSLTNDTLLRA